MSTSTAAPARSYKVTSLERGLAILRVLRSAGGPTRNQDVVASTGLPKATVSRLMNTLTAMGYLRRTDQGAYVLGEQSGRSGRAMLDGLRLERYAPVFCEFADETGGLAHLEAQIGRTMVPVFSWSAAGSMLLANGPSPQVAAASSPSADCFEFSFGDSTLVHDVFGRQLADRGWCHRWDESLATLSACTAIRMNTIGCFVLTMHVAQGVSPSAERLQSIGSHLLRAAAALSSGDSNLKSASHDNTSA